MVTYATTESPLGTLFLARSAKGLVRLAFGEEDTSDLRDELATLGEEVTPGDLSAERQQLDEYFAGTRTRFTLPLDLSLIPTDFSRRVLEATTQIPYGSVATYGRVAELAGSPRGARPAGNALHSNPVALVIPCHRVLPADRSTIGGYAGREDRKAWLLALEGSLDVQD